MSERAEIDPERPLASNPPGRLLAHDVIARAVRPA